MIRMIPIPQSPPKLINIQYFYTIFSNKKTKFQYNLNKNEIKAKTFPHTDKTPKTFFFY